MDYIGTVIPTVSVNISGVLFASSAGNYIIPINKSQIAVATKVIQLKAESEFTFTNPIKDNFQFASAKTVSDIEIYGLTGQKMFSKHFNNSNSGYVEMSRLPKGIYMARIRFSSGNVTVLKMMKN